MSDRHGGNAAKGREREELLSTHDGCGDTDRADLDAAHDGVAHHAVPDYAGQHRPAVGLEPRGGVVRD